MCTRKLRAGALLCWLIATGAAAQHPPVAEGSPARAEPGPCSPPRGPRRCARLAAAFDLRFGLAAAPFVSERLPEVRGHGFVARVASALALPRRHVVGLELPFAVISVAQPAGSYVDEVTRGNLALFVRRSLVLQQPRATLLPFGALALGLPVAERKGGALYLASRALAIASALDAYRSQESFTPGTIPLTASLGLRVQRGRWIAETRLRVPVYFRFSDVGLPAGAETRRVGLTPSLHTSAAVRAWPWLWISLDLDAVFNAVAPVAFVGEPGWAQLSSTAAAWFALHERVSLGVDFVAPLGGPLGGSNYSGALSVGAGW